MADVQSGGIEGGRTPPHPPTTSKDTPWKGPVNSYVQALKSGDEKGIIAEERDLKEQLQSDLQDWGEVVRGIVREAPGTEAGSKTRVVKWEEKIIETVAPITRYTGTWEVTVWDNSATPPKQMMETRELTLEEGLPNVEGSGAFHIGEVASIEDKMPDGTVLGMEFDINTLGDTNGGKVTLTDSATNTVQTIEVHDGRLKYTPPEGETLPPDILDVMQREYISITGGKLRE